MELKLRLNHDFLSGGPQYKHDCDHCIFLGRCQDKDLYICTGDQSFTLIVRRSSEAPDYTSGACFAFVNPWLNEALRRAHAMGLITEMHMQYELREAQERFLERKGNQANWDHIDERYKEAGLEPFTFQE